MTGAALHRLSQFWRHSAARVTAAELNRARTILGPDLSGFFADLPVNDQRHGLDVLETVDQSVTHPPSLLQQAALLHDMGKVGAGFSIVERSLTVLLQSLAPRLLRELLRARPAFARRYAIYADHARIGAERLRAAGATELASVVAEHHVTHPEHEVTRLLQRADHAN
jgi:hypothetical protein